MALNSSNSNIEEEFEQIKLQILALTEIMFKQNEGASPRNNLSEGNEFDQSEGTVNATNTANDSIKKKKLPSNIIKNLALLELNQEQHDDHTERMDNSLFCFGPDNKCRLFLKNVIHNSYFAGFIYHMIALNSLLLILDSPSLDHKY